MTFVKLTRKIDKKEMYINPEHVAAVYPYYNKDTTVIQLAGSDDNWLEVSESIRYVVNMLEDSVR